jgi:hypothetical protein
MAVYQEPGGQPRLHGEVRQRPPVRGQAGGRQTPEARVVIFTEPGQEGQVDYGEGPMVRDPATGKYRRTRLFVFTLGHSGKSVRLLVFKSSSRAWAELHERA